MIFSSSPYSFKLLHWPEVFSLYNVWNVWYLSNPERFTGYFNQIVISRHEWESELWPKVEETAFSLVKRVFPGQVFSRENGTSCVYNKQYLSHTLVHASGPLLTQVSDTHTSSYARILCKLLFTRVKGLKNVIVLSTAHYRGINACLCTRLAFVPRCFLTHLVSKMICSLHLQ